MVEKIAVVLLCAAACAACGKGRAVQGEDASQAIEDFSMTQTSSGRKVWSLAAPRAQLLSGGGAKLLTPRIELFRDGTKTSTAEAQEAYVRDGSQDLLLTGDVVLRSPQEKTTLRTPRLEYRSKEARFHTDEAVVIERPGASMKGRGLDADSALSEIRIHHMESKLR
ncbi:MAG: LPS export ABC transporter periplasmic protein LptC [Elusimicrobiota bacterium]